MRPKVPFVTLPHQFSFLVDSPASSFSLCDVPIPPAASAILNGNISASAAVKERDETLEIFSTSESVFDDVSAEERIKQQARDADLVDRRRRVDEMPFAFRRYDGFERSLPPVSYPAFAPLKFVVTEADAWELLDAAKKPCLKADGSQQHHQQQSQNQRCSVVAIDTETQPPFFRPPHLRQQQRGMHFPPDLVQVATRTGCFLVRTSPANPMRSEPAIRALMQILRDPFILKCGLGINADLKSVQLLDTTIVGGADSKAAASLSSSVPRAVVDLGLAARAAAIESRPGLAPLVAAAFRRRLSKAFQMSNWGARRLASNQLLYAATDSWICLHLLDVFLSEKLVRPHGEDLLLLHRPLVTAEHKKSERSVPLWEADATAAPATPSGELAAAREEMASTSGKQKLQQQQSEQIPSATPKFVIIDHFDPNAVSFSLADLLRLCQSTGAVKMIQHLERRRAANATCENAGEGEGERTDSTPAGTATAAVSPEVKSVLLIRCGNKHIAPAVAQLLACAAASLNLPSPASIRVISSEEASQWTYGREIIVLDSAVAHENVFVPKHLILSRRWLPTPTRFLAPLRPMSVDADARRKLIDAFAEHGLPMASDIAEEQRAGGPSSPSSIAHIVSVEICDEWKTLVIEMSSIDAAIRAMIKMNGVASPAFTDKIPSRSLLLYFANYDSRQKTTDGEKK